MTFLPNIFLSAKIFMLFSFFDLFCTKLKSFNIYDKVPPKEFFRQLKNILNTSLN